MPLTCKRVAKLVFSIRENKFVGHFEFSEGKTELIGKTAGGRAMVIALKLNNARSVEMRKLWVSVGWFSPKD